MPSIVWNVFEGSTITVGKSSTGCACASKAAGSLLASRSPVAFAVTQIETRSRLAGDPGEAGCGLSASDATARSATAARAITWHLRWRT